MASDPLLMGIDLGTSSVKVVLTTIAGTVAGQGAAEYGIDRPAPDRARGCLRRLPRGVPEPPARVPETQRPRGGLAQLLLERNSRTANGPAR